MLTFRQAPRGRYHDADYAAANPVINYDDTTYNRGRYTGMPLAPPAGMQQPFPGMANIPAQQDYRSQGYGPPQASYGMHTQQYGGAYPQPGYGQQQYHGYGHPQQYGYGHQQQYGFGQQQQPGYGQQQYPAQQGNNYDPSRGYGSRPYDQRSYGQYQQQPPPRNCKF